MNKTPRVEDLTNTSFEEAEHPSCSATLTTPNLHATTQRAAHSTTSRRVRPRQDEVSAAASAQAASDRQHLADSRGKRSGKRKLEESPASLHFWFDTNSIPGVEEVSMLFHIGSTLVATEAPITEGIICCSDRGISVCVGYQGRAALCSNIQQRKPKRQNLRLIFISKAFAFYLADLFVDERHHNRLLCSSSCCCSLSQMSGMP